MVRCWWCRFFAVRCWWCHVSWCIVGGAQTGLRGGGVGVFLFAGCVFILSVECVSFVCGVSFLFMELDFVVCVVFFLFVGRVFHLCVEGLFLLWSA